MQQILRRTGQFGDPELCQEFPEDGCHDHETGPGRTGKGQGSTELPQLFVDRNIKSNFTKAVAGAKRVEKACTSAIEAAVGGIEKALPFLKTAKTELEKVKEVNDQYLTAVGKFGKTLDVSKDKDKIEKMIAAIAKAYETAERKFRGAATTIKKAG